jgi:hypothetical protein
MSHGMGEWRWNRTSDKLMRVAVGEAVTTVPEGIKQVIVQPDHKHGLARLLCTQAVHDMQQLVRSHSVGVFALGVRKIQPWVHRRRAVT